MPGSSELVAEKRVVEDFVPEVSFPQICAQLPLVVGSWIVTNWFHVAKVDHVLRDPISKTLHANWWAFFRKYTVQIRNNTVIMYSYMYITCRMVGHFNENRRIIMHSYMFRT